MGGRERTRVESGKARTLSWLFTCLAMRFLPLLHSAPVTLSMPLSANDQYLHSPCSQVPGWALQLYTGEQQT